MAKKKETRTWVIKDLVYIQPDIDHEGHWRVRFRNTTDVRFRALKLDSTDIEEAKAEACQILDHVGPWSVDKPPTKKEVTDAVRILIRHTGHDVEKEGVQETPDRVYRAYKELFSGYKQDPHELLEKSFSETKGYDEMISLTDIPFTSHCEHHMVPFIGYAHVAYIPRDRVVGISKIARLVDAYAKRLQIQERMTSQIVYALQSVLDPLGAAVVIEAQHMCMTARGANKHGVKMKTSRMFGAFKDDDKTRKEFLSMIGGGAGN